MIISPADYPIEGVRYRRHPVGFESDCWVVDGRWFVKVWRRADPPAGLELLTRLRSAGLPVPVPLPTHTGELFAWWRGRPYAVFPYVSGRPADDRDGRLTARVLRRVHESVITDLPVADLEEPEIRRLAVILDHPWIVDRADELRSQLRRLDRVIERARAKPIRRVLCHRDFGGANLIIADGSVAAVLDWEQAVHGPREHDLWIAAEGPGGADFLTAYGARDLDLDHLEYALLARALRDLAARVLIEADRPGVDTWGFRRIARLDADLAMFRPFCA